jgi:hypothetical protein
MAFLFGLWAAAVTLVSNGASDWNTSSFLTAWFVGAIYCVFVGYFYVAFASVVYIFFERVGVIQSDHWLSPNAPMA